MWESKVERVYYASAILVILGVFLFRGLSELASLQLLTAFHERVSVAAVSFGVIASLLNFNSWKRIVSAMLKPKAQTAGAGVVSESSSGNKVVGIMILKVFVILLLLYLLSLLGPKMIGSFLFGFIAHIIAWLFLLLLGLLWTSRA